MTTVKEDLKKIYEREWREIVMAAKTFKEEKGEVNLSFNYVIYNKLYFIYQTLFGNMCNKEFFITEFPYILQYAFHILSL